MTTLQLPEPGGAGIALLLVIFCAVALIAWIGGPAAVTATAAVIYAVAVLSGRRPPSN
jgi:hypothetical protein